MGLFSRRGESDGVVVKRAFGSKRFVEEETHERETYHGVLRSELDEPSKLPQAFEMLIEEANRARHQYERAELTKTQLAEVLQGLRVTGPDGTEWTMGATSGRWYRRPQGGTWVPSLPPEDDGEDSFHETGSQVAVSGGEVHDEEDFMANIDALLKGGLESFSVDEQVRPTESVSPWPEVTSAPSEVAPVAFEAAQGAVFDEHGSWDTSWDARGEKAEPAAFGDLPDLSAFETPPVIDGGGWAAWGVRPE